MDYVQLQVDLCVSDERESALVYLQEFSGNKTTTNTSIAFISLEPVDPIEKVPGLNWT